LDILYEIDLNRLEVILTNMYKQLNKRLSIAQHINIETMSLLLTSWLLNLFDSQKINKIKLFSLKIALTTLCSGRLIDKIKCNLSILFYSLY
jgi:tRNA(Met) C34 N-acetyltransferase TmcA